MNRQIITEPSVSLYSQDQHHFFDHYADFNAWLEESDDAQSLRDGLGLDNLSQPAKALFAGDKASTIKPSNNTQPTAAKNC
ncbi:hypothetical protein [Methylomonas koyamae]|uniref:hypothetical protein n=1 Tax=Methylomonas koyamae TaxID=702114 RepID=UPI000AEC7178|nr:hypothetical protein [Methylomonas koyamae]